MVAIVAILSVSTVIVGLSVGESDTSGNNLRSSLEDSSTKLEMGHETLKKQQAEITQGLIANERSISDVRDKQEEIEQELKKLKADRSTGSPQSVQQQVPSTVPAQQPSVQNPAVQQAESGSWAGEPCSPGFKASQVRNQIANRPDVDGIQDKLMRAIKRAGAVPGPKSVFIDIGANRGDFTAEMAGVWPGQQHYTFEMMPKMQPIIRNTLKNVVPSENLHQVQNAVSDQSGQEVPILGAAGVKADWTMFSLLERAPKPGQDFTKVVDHATTVAIGEWADREGSIGRDADIPMMKIDTEGMDGMVMRGMTTPYDILGSGKIKSIFFELNKICLKSEMPPGKQFALLSEKGYDTYLFTPNKLPRISDDCFRADDYVYNQLYTRNAVSLPKGTKFSCCVLTYYDGKDRGCGC